LHHENILHCDLAARNVLVTSTLMKANGKKIEKYVCKVADFGLSHIASNEGTFDAGKDTKIPIRWSSPEVVKDQHFSKACDVWSYGITLYEILQREKPFNAMRNAEVMEEICSKGCTLPRPTAIEVPEELYLLMRDCWNMNPNERPAFSDIGKRLKGIENSLSPAISSEKNNNPNPVQPEITPTQVYASRNSSDRNTYGKGKGIGNGNYN